MTDTTQDPLAELMRLVDNYSETRHKHGCRDYNRNAAEAYADLSRYARTLTGRITSQAVEIKKLRNAASLIAGYSVDHFDVLSDESIGQSFLRQPGTAERVLRILQTDAVGAGGVGAIWNGSRYTRCMGAGLVCCPQGTIIKKETPAGELTDAQLADVRAENELENISIQAFRCAARAGIAADRELRHAIDTSTERVEIQATDVQMPVVWGLVLDEGGQAIATISHDPDDVRIIVERCREWESEGYTVSKLVRQFDALAALAAQAVEIERLTNELRYIANADVASWDDPSEFKAWAQSRARAAIAKEKTK